MDSITPLSKDPSLESRESIGDEVKIEDAKQRGLEGDIETWYNAEFPDAPAGHKFWQVASELTGSLWVLHFKSFEVLNLALILRSQQQLILMNRQILESKGELLARNDIATEARQLLRDYYDDIKRSRSLQELRVECPGKPHGHPNEPEGHPNSSLWTEPTAYAKDGTKIWNHYRDTDVAYLCPEQERPQKDRVRRWLQHVWGKPWLDDVAVQQRLFYENLVKEYKEVIWSNSRGQTLSSSLLVDWRTLIHCMWFRLVLIPLDFAGFKLVRPSNSRLRALRHQIKVLGNRFQVSPVVDIWSRWVIAMIGVVLLIIPLLALTYIPEQGYTQVIAVCLHNLLCINGGFLHESEQS